MLCVKMNLMYGYYIVAVAQFHLQYFLSSQIMHNNILLHLLKKEFIGCKRLIFVKEPLMMNIPNLGSQESVGDV